MASDIGAAKRYLDTLMARLRGAGIVAAFQGPGGGFSFAMPAKEVTLLDIMTACGELPPAGRPMGTIGGDERYLQTALPPWALASAAYRNELASVTLESLIAELPDEHSAEQMYYI